jgi:ankyrin repeat protein
MLEAIQADDRDGVAELLAASPGLADARTPGGVSALMVAAYLGRAAIVRMILQRRGGFDVFEAAAFCLVDSVHRSLETDPDALQNVSPDGLTPLHLAARFAQTEMLRMLVERGAEIDAVSHNPLAFTPLHAAVAGHCLECAELLLDAGANANFRQADGLTPLMASAATGQVELVELLLDHGASIGLRSRDGYTARDLAVDNGYDEIADLLDA